MFTLEFSIVVYIISDFPGHHICERVLLIFNKKNIPPKFILFVEKNPQKTLNKMPIDIIYPNIPLYKIMDIEDLKHY